MLSPRNKRETLKLNDMKRSAPKHLKLKRRAWCPWMEYNKKATPKSQFSRPSKHGMERS